MDDEYPGVNFERPAFQEMMEEIRDGMVNCVIVKDLSRFGRKYTEVGNYIEKIFLLMDVRFIAINDDYDSAEDSMRHWEKAHIYGYVSFYLGKEEADEGNKNVGLCI